MEQQVRFCTARRWRAARVRRPRPAGRRSSGGDLADASRLRLGEPGVAPLAGRAGAATTRSSATTSGGAGCPTASSAISSVETWVGDLETVVDAAGLDRFTLLGISQGAAVAVVYAARHPERVSRPRPLWRLRARAEVRAAEARRRRRRWSSAIRAGWADPNPTFRHLFSMLFLPTARRSRWRGTTSCSGARRSAETAVRLYRGARRDRRRATGAAGHRADAGRPRTRRPRRAGRGGPAAGAADPGRPAGAAGVGEPHPAGRRAGLARASWPSFERSSARRRRVAPSRRSATSARASSRCSSWSPPA